MIKTLTALLFLFSVSAQALNVEDCQRQNYSYTGVALDEKVQRIESRFAAATLKNYEALVAIAMEVLQEADFEQLLYIAEKGCKVNPMIISDPATYLIQARAVIGTTDLQNLVRESQAADSFIQDVQDAVIMNIDL